MPVHFKNTLSFCYEMGSYFTTQREESVVYADICYKTTMS